MDTHLSQNNLHEPLQFAYTPSHSTETAVFKVTNDILLALDCRQGIHLPYFLAYRPLAHIGRTHEIDLNLLKFYDFSRIGRTHDLPVYTRRLVDLADKSTPQY